MKKTIIVGLVLLILLIGGGLFWHHARREAQSAYQGATDLAFSGMSGSQIVGYYVRSGQRIAVSNSVPFSLDGSEISSFEFRKVHLDDSVVLAVSYDSDSARAKASVSLDPSVLGVRGRIQNGLITETFKQ